MDIVRRIQAFNAGREPERLRLKYRALRSSPFAFLRGTCHLFFDRLPRRALFKTAPLAWLCGDLHLENFGSYKGDNRLVYFDLNDFDEAALAPVSWDLLRLLTSVWIAADDLAIDSADARTLCQAFIEAYGSALVSGKALWMERETAHGLVGDLLAGLRDRPRPRFLDMRTVRHGNRRALRVDGKKALASSDAQCDAITRFMRDFARSQPDPAFYQVLDVARRIAGTGSLGVDRHVILIHGKGSPDGNYLLDLKQALPSSLTSHLRATQPSWPTEAHRVVALQRRVQAVSMAFLQPVLLDGQPYVLRGLQPSEDRIALKRSGQTAAELHCLMADLGRLVAWAQLRSAGREGSAIADELIAFGASTKWRKTLLVASHDCALQLREDAASYNAAFDAGAFDV